MFPMENIPRKILHNCAVHYPCPAPRVVGARHDPVETTHDVCARAVSPDVLQAGEPLFEEAVHLGVGLSLGGHGRHGDIADAHHDEHRECGKRREGNANAPILNEEGDEYAYQEQDVAQHLYDELGEEARQGVHIAVYALYHLAWGAGLVEAHVEAQAVEHQIYSKVVGGGPAHVLAQVGGCYPQKLGHEGYAQEDDGSAYQRIERAPGDGGVYEEAHNLRVGKLQERRSYEHDREQPHAYPLRA